MFEKIFVTIQYLLPQHLLSRLVGLLANCQSLFIKDRMISWFIQHYGVDISQAERSMIADYKSFNDFFTRRLKPTARPIADSTIISPADGALSQIGKLQEGRYLQAKHHQYRLQSLLANADWYQQFNEGYFATVYLSPKDYHRVHMPCDGQLLETIYVPGKLFSVNDATTQRVPELFARNERLICRFHSETLGEFVVIFVGAMIVAGIHTVWSGKVTPNRFRSTQLTSYQDQSLRYKKGDEIGFFEMGSTVILLFGSQSTPFSTDYEKSLSVKMGEKLF